MSRLSAHAGRLWLVFVDEMNRLGPLCPDIDPSLDDEEDKGRAWKVQVRVQSEIVPRCF